MLSLLQFAELNEATNTIIWVTGFKPPHITFINAAELVGRDSRASGPNLNKSSVEINSFPLGKPDTVV